MRLLGSLIFTAFMIFPALVIDVRTAALSGDFATAEKLLKSAPSGSPEYLEAMSWIGRGQLAARNYALAEKNAAEVRRLAIAQLKARKLDAEPHLPLALGASIEVQSQALAAEGKRDEAVLFLHAERKRWQGASIAARIQKNLNLLTLQGQPAPPLDVSNSIGPVAAKPLAAHKGHPLLLFFWAHWCPDCKIEVAVVRKLNETYGPSGLVVIAPTQHYGYAAGGEDVAPAVETEYIKAVFAKYYSRIGKVEVPLSEGNFTAYGVSTTPTIVLVDAHGLVRLYNPGALSYEPLALKLEGLFGK